MGWCGVDCGWKWDVPLTTEIDAAVRFATCADEVHVFMEEGIGDYVFVNGPPVDCACGVESCRLCIVFEAGEVMVPVSGFS